MVFRVGEYIFTPSFLILPFSFALFGVIALRGLHDAIANPKTRHAAVCAAAIGASFGAAGIGMVSALLENAPRDWFGLSLSSLGFYWGALVGLGLFSAFGREPILPKLDAIVPAVLVAGILARIGCLYTGCCRGIEISPICFHGWRPFYLWPFYDMAALLVTGGALAAFKRRTRFPGASCAFFLIGYGLLRFVIEFLRNAAPLFGPFTVAHELAGLQILVGVVLAGNLWRIRRTTRLSLSDA